MMIELMSNELVFQFPEVHKDASCSINFQRTLRIPDDNKEYPLPPGLGCFHMEHVEDHVNRLPSSWNEHGGVLLHMYQAEALWINFSSNHHSLQCVIPYPFAVKVAAGKVNAITGDKWSNDLKEKPQDYMVIPDQPWLDGFHVQKDLVRQFVAMPLGKSYTAEEQIFNAAKYGGIQIIVYPMKRECYEHLLSTIGHQLPINYCMTEEISDDFSMGLASGGLMRQEIYQDEYGYDVWDMSNFSRCYVHILNSKQWTIVTGKEMPSLPITAAQYTESGLPWFDYYDESLSVLSGSNGLAQLDSVAAKGIKKGENPLPEAGSVQPNKIITLNAKNNEIREGEW